jgi:hypothetical protein
LKFLPTPPTDNLYKFSAISGLLCCLGSIVVLVYFTYLGVHFDKAGELQMHSYSAQKTLDKVNCRLDALKNGDVDKCPLDTMKLKDGSEKEVSLLNNIKKVQESTVNEYKKHSGIAKPLSENIEWVVEKKVYWIITSIPGLSFILFCFGFVSWYRKVQKPSNQMTILNLEIRQLEKSKLEAELIKLTKIEKKPFSKR